MHLEIIDEKSYKSFSYFHIQAWNYDNDGVLEDWGYVRTTTDSFYEYNPYGDDYLQHKKASVGTKWSFYRERNDGLNYKVIEIINIESVTVPYGQFDEAYVTRRYRSADPNDLSKGKSPDWYEWIVPNVGWVKQVDYWADNAPFTMELERKIKIFYTQNELEKAILNERKRYDPSVDGIISLEEAIYALQIVAGIRKQFPDDFILFLSMYKEGCNGYPGIISLYDTGTGTMEEVKDNCLDVNGPSANPDKTLLVWAEGPGEIT